MSIQATPPPFRSDSRANRLESWATTNDSGTGHFLWLRTADAVVAQLLTLAPDYLLRQLPPNLLVTWTHVFSSPGALRPDVDELLGVLGATLTLSCPATLDFVLALDWYKKPVDGISATSWPNTEIGELVYLGKYRYKTDGDRQAKVGLRLMSKVSDAIRGHPLLRKADIILDVPGHDTERVSFGSRMADAVGRDFEIPRIRVKARDKFRAEAKSLDRSQRAKVLAGQFSVSHDLQGRTVLIVDDVFHSGASMGETARAARDAGANRVLGICAVRNLRR
ncbi:MAG: ComF family protein [Pseudonocardiaceae bacterium]